MKGRIKEDRKQRWTSWKGDGRIGSRRRRTGGGMRECGRGEEGLQGAMPVVAENGGEGVLGLAGERKTKNGKCKIRKCPNRDILIYFC